MLCCFSYYGVASKEDKVAYNFNYKRDKEEALKAFENGKFPDACRGCEQYEEIGKESYREIGRKMFPETTKLLEEKSNQDFEVEFMDLKLGNTCNMSCRMCNPQSSSLLEKENFKSKMFLENPPQLNFNWPKDPAYWEEISKHSNSLKRIHLAGGEPMIVDEVKDYLGELVSKGKSKDITLFINTNGSVYSEEWKELIANFKNTNIYFSIDGVEKTYEVIRYPAKWDRIKENLGKWSELALNNEKLELTILAVVQIYNLFDIEELLEFNESLKGFSKEIKSNILMYPHHFDIKNLPEKIKAEAKLYLMDLIPKFPKNREVLKDALSKLSESQDVSEFEKFKEINKQFDNLRKQNSYSSIGGSFNKLVKGDS